ncbi:MAG: ATP-binding cassette domain-containing protein, partial [Clostridiales bacterium]|nr:ATP-binding cassette domain-containing protein [Clostridiales bacterium]
MPITVKNLTYTYMKKTPYETRALSNVSLKIKDGDFLGIIGSTGSGKSTLIRHLNGLIALTEGSIIVDEIDLGAKKPNLKLLRQKIGMVFQYPESQLFAETVLKDVCYGPKNMKKSDEECTELAREALELVGLRFDEFKDRSPFE